MNNPRFLFVAAFLSACAGADPADSDPVDTSETDVDTAETDLLDTDLVETDLPDTDVVDTDAPDTDDTDGMVFLPQTFTAEAGFRIRHAGNAKAGYNADAHAGPVGIYLYHQPKDGTEPSGGGGGMLSTIFAYSEDGLTFDAAEYTEVATGACNGQDGARIVGHSERLALPEGGYRLYRLMQGPMAAFQSFSSMYSDDGVVYCNLPTDHYELGPNDNGTMGIYTTFVAEHTENQVVLLYLGDLFGDNNTRRAVAGGDGDQFEWHSDNVLGDAGGEASQAYVDISTVPAAPGVRRLFSMQGGNGIYSFITHDDGVSFVQEPGPRLTPSDFDGLLGEDFTTCAFFDPTLVQIPDGSGGIAATRMYLTSRVWDASVPGCDAYDPCTMHQECDEEVILSAVTTDL